MLSREANTTCSFFRKFVKFVSYKYKEFNIIIIIQLLELTSIEFITFFFKGKVTLILIASASVYMIYKDPTLKRDITLAYIWTLSNLSYWGFVTT